MVRYIACIGIRLRYHKCISFGWIPYVASGTNNTAHNAIPKYQTKGNSPFHVEWNQFSPE